MKRISFVLAALLTGCASMPQEQRAYEAAYQVLHIADTIQTLNIKDRDGGYETNPILGRNPSDGAIIAYMTVEASIHAYVTHTLAKHDAPMWLQRTWHSLSIGYNGMLVIRNESRGY